jgi:hypothetical protein
MPTMPPGNSSFHCYFDANLKLQARYIGPEPIVCANCGRTTYATASGRCPWASLCKPVERAA